MKEAGWPMIALALLDAGGWLGCRHRSAAQGNSLPELSDAGVPRDLDGIVVSVSRPISLCAGSAVQLGWARAQETRAIVRVHQQEQGARVSPDFSGERSADLSLSIDYETAGGRQVTQAVGVVEPRSNYDRWGNDRVGARSLRSRARIVDAMQEAVLDWAVDISAEEEFDLSSSEHTTWFLCAPEVERPQTCQWRVSLSECESTVPQEGTTTVDLGDLGFVAFEVARAYTDDRSSQSRITRATGRLDGRDFDQRDYFSLFLDSYDVNFQEERFGVMLPNLRAGECGLAVETAHNELPSMAYTFDCAFQRLRDLPVLSIRNE